EGGIEVECQAVREWLLTVAVGIHDVEVGDAVRLVLEEDVLSVPEEEGIAIVVGVGGEPDVLAGGPVESVDVAVASRGRRVDNGKPVGGDGRMRPHILSAAGIDVPSAAHARGAATDAAGAAREDGDEE